MSAELAWAILLSIIAVLAGVVVWGGYIVSRDWRSQDAPGSEEER